MRRYHLILMLVEIPAYLAFARELCCLSEQHPVAPAQDEGVNAVALEEA